MVETVVTMSQVNFVPRDRNSSWRQFKNDKHGPPQRGPPPDCRITVANAIAFLFH